MKTRAQKMAAAAERMEEKELRKPTGAREKVRGVGEVPSMELGRAGNYDGDRFQCICGNTAAVGNFWDAISSRFVCENCGRSWTLTQMTGPWKVDRYAARRFAHALKRRLNKDRALTPTLSRPTGEGELSNVAGAKGRKKHKNKG